MPQNFVGNRTAAQIPQFDKYKNSQSDTRLSPRVVVETIKLADKGAIRAFATITIGEVKIHGVKVIQQQGKTAWIALPSTEIANKNEGGGKRYFPVVEVADGALKNEISAVVLAAFATLEDSGDEDRPF